MSKFKKRDGSALIIAIIILTVVIALAMSYFTVSTSRTVESRVLADSRQAIYYAEAGISEAFKLIATEKWHGPHENVNFTADNANVFIEDIDDAGAYRRVVSTSNHGGYSRTIEAVIGGLPVHPLFTKGLFAGNKNGLANDALDFGGTGGDADEIDGDVYSNTDIDFTGDSNVNGTVTSTGAISGYSQCGAILEAMGDVIAPPDLDAMDYENFQGVVKVDDTLNWDTSWNSNQGGRIADENDPAHIFIKDLLTPQRLADEYHDATGGPDDHYPENTNFWLMDWAESLVNYRNIPITRHPVTNKAMRVHPVSVAPTGNNKVYYVDGNLWIDVSYSNRTDVSNPDQYSDLEIQSAGEGTRITIVVKGNIYIGDGLYVKSKELDGLALIAMSDGDTFTDMDGDNWYTAGTDYAHLQNGSTILDSSYSLNGPKEGSGNIFYGDQYHGSSALSDITAYMYAENNYGAHALKNGNHVHDILVHGNMTAGNLFKVERDFGWLHSKLEIIYDDRLANDPDFLPGIPTWNSDGVPFKVYSWRLIPTFGR